MVLRMGPADYKTFVVTRLRDPGVVWEKCAGGEVGAMGNSAFVTRGDQALVGDSVAEGVRMRGGRIWGGCWSCWGRRSFRRRWAGWCASADGVARGGGVGDDEWRCGEWRRWPRLMAVVEDGFLAEPEAVWQWEVEVSLEVVAPRFGAGGACGEFDRGARRGEGGGVGGDDAGGAVCVAGVAGGWGEVV